MHPKHCIGIERLTGVVLRSHVISLKPIFYFSLFICMHNIAVIYNMCRLHESIATSKGLKGPFLSPAETAIGKVGKKPGLLQSISYKRRQNNKDSLVVAWRGKKSRKGEVVLYGPDGIKIKAKPVKRNRRTWIAIPLRDGILQPGSTYTVRFFALRRNRRGGNNGGIGRASTQAVLMSTMEYTHPIPPSPQPSMMPTSAPSRRPSSLPTHFPSAQPSIAPTTSPSSSPIQEATSAAPSFIPSARPSPSPSAQPSTAPTAKPSSSPTQQPSSTPSVHPTGQPSSNPSQTPSAIPSVSPSAQPSHAPSLSAAPSVSAAPSSAPTPKPTPAPTVDPIALQRAALKSLYDATDGDSWGSSSWFTTDNYCTWSGVSCDVKGNVVKIELGGYGLRGSIPDEFWSLVHLQHLDLSNNDVSGTIPSTIGSLVNLQHLDLYETDVSGSIPSTIAQLQKLEVFNVAETSVSGEIPDGFCDLFDIGKLKTFWADFADGNTLIERGEEYYGGYGCWASSSYSDELDSAATFCKSVSIFSPALSSIALQRGALKSLYDATDGDNWGSYSWFTTDNDNYCIWGGVCCDRQGNIVEIELGWSSLHGSIPDEIGSLIHLRYLNLSGNAISGIIPSTIVSLVNLQELYLYETGISGTIPSTISSLVNLQHLDLHNTGISGTIPSTIAQLQSLEVFDIRYTSVSGEIPDGGCDLFDVGKLKTFWANFANGNESIERTSYYDENGWSYGYDKELDSASTYCKSIILS